MTPPTLQSRIFDRLEEAPDARALLHYRGRTDDAWISRSQLLGQAAGSADRLSTNGLEAAETCLIVMPSDEPVEPILLGALLAGATPLLLAPPTFWRSNPDLGNLLRGLIERSSATVVVRPEPLSELDEEGPGRPHFLSPKELTGVGDAISWRLRATSGRAPAALQMTSGTTGLPRICAWSHEAVLATLDAMADAMRVDRETVYFNWTPLYHDLGLVNNFLFCLARGIPLATMSPVRFVRRPASWLRGLCDTGATTTWAPNFGFSLAAHRVRDAELEGVRLDHVDGFWNAAEKIHLRTMHDFHRRFASCGVRYSALKASYGCAENVGGATFSAPDDGLVVEFVDREALFGSHRAEPADENTGLPIVGVGRPVSGLGIRILSDSGDDLPDGGVGEIALRSDSPMRGYLGEPEATRAVLDDSTLRTGDLGYLRGDQLFWVGRLRERITTRGQKIDPSSFESILLGVDGLRQGCFAAFGIDDPALGTERLVVVSEVRTPLERQPSEIAGEVRKRVFQRLETRIDDVMLVPPGSLGKTSSGKRRNRHFKRLYESKELDSLRLRDEPADD